MFLGVFACIIDHSLLFSNVHVSDNSWITIHCRLIVTEVLGRCSFTAFSKALQLALNYKTADSRMVLSGFVSRTKEMPIKQSLGSTNSSYALLQETEGSVRRF